jgi:DNA-binding XRE family transcriptional regulator
MTADGNTLARELEEMEDERDALAAILAKIRSANQEMLPWKLIRRLSDGASPLLVWREHRGLTADELADKTGVDTLTIAAIESAKADPSLRDAAALARALGIDAEDLLPWPQD